MQINKEENGIFPIGYYDFHKKQLFNYQLNRWYSLGLADFEDFKIAAEKITSFEEWKAEMKKLAEKALLENRIMNAAIYYRAAEFYTFNKNQKEDLYDKFSELFYRAISNEQMEKLKIPYESGHLPVIRLIPEKDNKGTIILHGGFDSFIEEFYYLIQYLKNHGYQIIAFEGPDQGNVLIKQGIALDYKWEKSVKKILDYFDLENVSIFGLSMGGWFALRAAAFEPRIKNVIATGHAVDYMKIPPAAAAWTMLFFIKHFRNYTVKSFKKEIKKGGQNSWQMRNLMQITKNNNPLEAFEYAMNLNKENLHPDLIKQNLFLMTAKNDHFIPFKLQKLQKKTFLNAKSLTERIFTKDEQADNHCQIGNIKLMLDNVLDWLIDK